MIVYKYLKKEHEQSFRDGFILVNTYEGIRKLDLEKANLPEDTSTPDSKIPDSKEGKITSHIPEMDINSSNSEEENMQKIETLKAHNMKVDKKISEIGGYVHIENFKCNLTLADAYMFCVTTKKDDLDWAEKEEYDSCIKILDFKEFTKRLSNTISQKNPNLDFLFTYQNCLYDGHNINYSNLNDFNNYFLKRPKYQKQAECRFIAVPVTKTDTKIQVTLTPERYKIDPTGLFEDCKTERKEYHNIQKINEDV